MKNKYRAKYNPLKKKWIIEKYIWFIGPIPIFDWESVFISTELDLEVDAQKLIDELNNPKIIYTK